MNTSKSQTSPEVDVVAHGRVTVEEIEYARGKIMHLGGYTREPVLYARVKLTHGGDPAVGPSWLRPNST